MNDLVDLNFGGPAPPQRTAASLDPWSPVGGAGGGVLQQSTLPDPWGGIGAVGVPPSRASPLAFPAPSPPAPANDPWGPAEPAQTQAQDPWGAPARPGVSPNPGKGKRGSIVRQWAALCPAVDPFSPADPLDPLAGLGGLQSTNGNGHGVFGGSPVGGAASPPRPANPWDLSGLDPVGGAQLLGAAPLQVGWTDGRPGERLCLECFVNGFLLDFIFISFICRKPEPSRRRAQWRACWASTARWSTWTAWWARDPRPVPAPRPRTRSQTSQTPSRRPPLPSPPSTSCAPGPRSVAAQSRAGG